MKKKSLWIVLVILLSLNILFIFITDLLTFELIPGKGISGNGNPGIIMWFFEIPCYVALLVLIFVITRKEQYFKHAKAAIPFVLLVLFGFVLYLQYIHADRIYKMIDGRIEDFGVINQYTNTVFINYYSFLCGILGLLSLQSFVQKFFASPRSSR